MTYVAFRHAIGALPVVLQASKGFVGYPCWHSTTYDSQGGLAYPIGSQRPLSQLLASSGRCCDRSRLDSADYSPP
jgi:hypothetical protein